MYRYHEYIKLDMSSKMLYYYYPVSKKHFETKIELTNETEYSQEENCSSSTEICISIDCVDGSNVNNI